MTLHNSQTCAAPSEQQPWLAASRRPRALRAAPAPGWQALPFLAGLRCGLRKQVPQLQVPSEQEQASPPMQRHPGGPGHRTPTGPRVQSWNT